MTTIADTIRSALAEGMNNEQVLAAVKAEHPASNTTAACVSYYRSKMKKAGSATKTPEPTKMAKAVVAASGNPIYTVKGLKSFIGNEGHGFNATLYRDGKAVAFVYDDASGGPVAFEWKDFQGTKVEVEIEGHDGKTHTVRMTVEEKALFDFTRALPHTVCEWNDPNTGKPAIMAVDSEIYVSDLVNDGMTLKDIARMTKGKVAFIQDGKVYTIKLEPSEANIAKVKIKNVGAVILNGMSDLAALAAFRALQ